MELERVEYSLAGSNGDTLCTVSGFFSEGRKKKIAGTGNSSKEALWDMFMTKFPDLPSRRIQLVKLSCNERSRGCHATVCLRIGKESIRTEGTDEEPIRAKAQAIFRAINLFREKK